MKLLRYILPAILVLAAVSFVGYSQEDNSSPVLSKWNNLPPMDPNQGVGCRHGICIPCGQDCDESWRPPTEDGFSMRCYTCGHNSSEAWKPPVPVNDSGYFMRCHTCGPEVEPWYPPTNVVPFVVPFWDGVHMPGAETLAEFPEYLPVA